jgi:Fic family protein
MEALGFALRSEAVLASLTEDAATTGAIEGEALDLAQARSSITRLLDSFQGKLTSSNYATLARCSRDTALRDIESLITFGMLAREAAGGRSTAYGLVPPDTIEPSP